MASRVRGRRRLFWKAWCRRLLRTSRRKALPAHVHQVDPGDIERVHLIDSTPIGANIRSTVATYSGVLNILRKSFAALPAAKERGLKAGAFSYNTGSLRCPTCDGTGRMSLDVQFLPDVDIPCPDCAARVMAKRRIRFGCPCRFCKMSRMSWMRRSSRTRADELAKSIDCPHQRTMMSFLSLKSWRLRSSAFGAEWKSAEHGREVTHALRAWLGLSYSWGSNARSFRW